MARRAKASRPQVGLRVSGDMRNRLAKIAETNGRSINAEVVARLQRSFDTEDRFGTPQVVDLVETIGNVMNKVGRHAMMYDREITSIHQLQDWLFKPYPFEQAKQALNAVLESFRPEGEIVTPTIFRRGPGSKRDQKAYDALNREVTENFGRIIAAQELEKRKKGDE